METTELFQEDASLSSQYWETFARKRDLEPEKRLLLAILDNGIRAYRQHMLTNSRRFFEAERWLFSDSEAGPFSFEYICDVLGLSAAWLRETLRRWPREAPAEPRKKKHAHDGAALAPPKAPVKNSAPAARDDRRWPVVPFREHAARR